MVKDFTLIQTARPQYFASGLSESHPHATQKGQGTWIGKVGDPDREATGFSVGHLLKSSVITPGGRDTYEDDTKTRVTIRDSPARQQVSAPGASQSQPITPRRSEYTRRETSRTCSFSCYPRKGGRRCRIRTTPYPAGHKRQKHASHQQLTEKKWQTLNEREVNAASTKSATHHGQKIPAVNEGKTLFKTARAIVL